MTIAKCSRPALSRFSSSLSLVLFVSAVLMPACGKNTTSARKSRSAPSILDDDNVMDATGFPVASKAELDAVMGKSSGTADASLGRLFDFDDGLLRNPFSQAVVAGKPIFCEGEVPAIDVAVMDGANIKLTYEADVTACVNKPDSGGDSILVDRQIAAFSLIFACSSRDLAPLISDGTAKSVMATGNAFSCPSRGKDKPVTGRAYRFAGRVDGRFVGPRSEVPVREKFWRGYDAGSIGEPCQIVRDSANEDHFGSCRFFERAESINLADNSGKGRLLVATTSARVRAAGQFRNGDLSVQFNGWSAVHRFTPQDANVTLDFTRPSGECARYVLRFSGVNYEARDCSAF